jgi:hypothetical protein
VFEVDSDDFLRRFQMNFFDVYSDEYFEVIPHEPCWLLSGVSRCEGLDHATLTVTVTDKKTPCQRRTSSVSGLISVSASVFETHTHTWMLRVQVSAAAIN